MGERVAMGRTFLLETLSSSRTEEIDAADRLSAACDRINGATATIDYLGALVVPEDELVLHLVVAPAVAIVRRAAAEAGLDIERLVESVPVAGRRRRAIRIPARPYGRVTVGGPLAREAPSATTRASSVRERIPSFE